jgi:hypothetical protein
VREPEWVLTSSASTQQEISLVSEVVSRTKAFSGVLWFLLKGPSTRQLLTTRGEIPRILQLSSILPLKKNKKL